MGLERIYISAKYTSELKSKSKKKKKEDFQNIYLLLENFLPVYVKTFGAIKQRKMCQRQKRKKKN
jgi:hypothetical protein